MNKNTEVVEETVITGEPPDAIEDKIPDEEEIPEINFQDTINSWVQSVGGSKGILIYDLDRNEVAGEYNSNQKFETASLYKLFVVYAGYQMLQNGEWQQNDIVGRTGYTVLDCLDLAIRESNSVCAETLWNMIGRTTLNNIIANDFGINNFDLGDLTATPAEITTMMKIFYEHNDITDEDLIQRMEDSFLNQPITEYNWRQGLPSGFSDKALVYNKVGWNYDGTKWTIYDDAAIVKFANEERSFIITVMTSGVTYQKIRSFGSMVEEAFYKTNTY